MAEPAETVESDVALYDVVVRVPSGAKLEDIDRRAREAGVKPEKVDSLIKALKAVPQAKIGSRVTKERADAAKEQFTRAGLSVDVTPLLALTTMVTGTFDGLFTCPGCKKRVMLPANRQCPDCKVFVDKLDDEALMRRKIMEQERAMLDTQKIRDARKTEKSTQQSMEASIRAEVRKELEAKYGKKDTATWGLGGLLKLAAIPLVLAAVFIGGRGTSAGFSWAAISGQSDAKGAAPKDVDKMLDSVGPKGAAAGAGGAGNTAAAAAAGGAGTATGDPDIDDPLIRAAGGNRIGKEGISIEQAVGAATVLAKSVGNTTAERALAGGPSGPGGAGAGAADAAGAGGGGGGGGGAAAAAAAGGAQADPGAAGAAPAAAVPPQVKTLLALDFTRQLAEMGQWPRAQEMIKALKSRAAADPVAATAALGAEAEIRAWSMQSLAGERARAAADALLAQSEALPDAAARTRALAHAGVILSRHAHLPPEAARAFLSKAAESLKAIEDVSQRGSAIGDWAAALGEVLLVDATAKAKAGIWSKVQAANSQLDALIAQAPDASAQARLYAIDYQAKLQLGQQEKANASLLAGLALADKLPPAPERAALLRTMAQLSGAITHERMAASIAALQAQSGQKSGMARAQTLAQLALMHADAGLRVKAAELAAAARSTPGLSPAETTVLNADLIVRTEMAAAKVLHGVGMYAESEAVLRKVGGYLL
jgi:hypothetical protein